MKCVFCGVLFVCMSFGKLTERHEKYFLLELLREIQLVGEKLMRNRMSTHSLLLQSEVQSLSHVHLFATPRTAAYQDPQSMGFSRQEYWSGLPFPSRDLLIPKREKGTL